MQILDDSLQIEVRTSFFDWQIFFRIFIKIHNIEIRNRLLWVRWYHGSSTFPSYWNAKMPSFAQYELIKPRTKRKTGNMVDKYFSVISYHSEGLLQISILRNSTFSSDFNIVWIEPYHCTRVHLSVFCKLWTDPLINLKFYARRG